MIIWNHLTLRMNVEVVLILAEFFILTDLKCIVLIIYIMIDVKNALFLLVGQNHDAHRQNNSFCFSRRIGQKSESRRSRKFVGIVRRQTCMCTTDGTL